MSVHKKVSFTENADDVTVRVDDSTVEFHGDGSILVYTNKAVAVSRVANGDDRPAVPVETKSGERTPDGTNYSDTSSDTAPPMNSTAPEAPLTKPRPTTVVYFGASLDGFIARPDGALDWMGNADSGNDHGWAKLLNTVDAIVMGRATFETVLTFDPWPYGDKPVIVLSKTLKTVPDHLQGKAELSSLDPHVLLQQLADRGHKRVYIDGGKIIQSFMSQGLVDELVITTLPVLIGQGIRVFGTLTSDLKWEHVATESFDDGLVKSSYRRKPELTANPALTKNHAPPPPKP